MLDSCCDSLNQKKHENKNEKKKRVQNEAYL